MKLASASPQEALGLLALHTVPLLQADQSSAGQGGRAACSTQWLRARLPTPKGHLPEDMQQESSAAWLWHLGGRWKKGS